MRRYRSGLTDSTRWTGFPSRPGDIVISSPARCGTTWLQMICALLIFQDEALPAPLTVLSPWLDMSLRPLDDVREQLAAQRHRRFIKTHTPLRGLTWHLGGAWAGRQRDDLVLLHYADLHADPGAQMRRLAGRLGIRVEAARTNSSTLGPSSNTGPGSSNWPIPAWSTGCTAPTDPPEAGSADGHEFPRFDGAVFPVRENCSTAPKKQRRRPPSTTFPDASHARLRRFEPNQDHL